MATKLLDKVKEQEEKEADKEKRSVPRNSDGRGRDGTARYTIYRPKMELRINRSLLK